MVDFDFARDVIHFYFMYRVGSHLLVCVADFSLTRDAIYFYFVIRMGRDLLACAAYFGLTRDVIYFYFLYRLGGDLVVCAAAFGLARDIIYICLPSTEVETYWFTCDAQPLCECPIRSCDFYSASGQTRYVDTMLI